jgi:hypothetical protein
MPLLFTFLPETVIQALSWTLWQGILLSLIAGCIIFLTKKSSPLLRYNLLVATLVLFIVAVVTTFITQLNSTNNGTTQTTVTSILEPTVTSIPTNTQYAEKAMTFREKTITFLNTQSHWIVLAWLLLFVYKFISIKKKTNNFTGNLLESQDGSIVYTTSCNEKGATTPIGHYTNTRRGRLLETRYSFPRCNDQCDSASRSGSSTHSRVRTYSS